MNKYGIPEATIVEQYLVQKTDNVKKIKNKNATEEYKNTDELIADIQKIDTDDEMVLKRLFNFFDKKFWWIVKHPTFNGTKWYYFDKEVMDDVKGIVTLNFYKTLRILKNDSDILTGKSLKTAEKIIASYVRNFSYSEIFKILNIERNKYGQYVLVRYEYIDKETGLFTIKNYGNYRKSGETKMPVNTESEVEEVVSNKIIIDVMKEFINNKNDYEKELWNSLLGRKSIKQIAKDTGMKEITLYKRREKLMDEFRTYLKLN